MVLHLLSDSTVLVHPAMSHAASGSCWCDFAEADCRFRRLIRLCCARKGALQTLSPGAALKPDAISSVASTAAYPEADTLEL